MTDQHAAFKVLNFIKLQNWKILEITDAVPLTTQPQCPADTTALTTICTFVGQRGTQRVRIGCCSKCGYVGYIDRPSKEWTRNFYLDTYALRKSVPMRRPNTSRPRLSAFLELLRWLPVAKDRAVCEIGCGTGAYLVAVRDAGFRDVIGVENSRYRAEAARQNYNLAVLTAPFESQQSLSALTKRSPLSLIYSHHVLEHVDNIGEVVAAVSRLQRVGDYFINSLPNFSREPSLNVLFFLSHLHSFTKESFVRLFGRHGYEVVNDSFTTDGELYIAARKANSQIRVPAIHRDYVGEAVVKITNGLGLSSAYSQSRRYLACLKKADSCQQINAPLGGRISFVNKLICRDAGPENRYMLVCDTERRYTSEAESPLEIQFDGNIKLLYK